MNISRIWESVYTVVCPFFNLICAAFQRWVTQSYHMSSPVVDAITAPEFEQIPQKKLVNTAWEWAYRIIHIHITKKKKRHTKDTEADSTNFKLLLSRLRSTTAAYTRKSSENRQQSWLQRRYSEKIIKVSNVAPVAARYTKFTFNCQPPHSLSEAVCWMSALIVWKWKRSVISKWNALCLPDTDWGETHSVHNCKNGWMCLSEWLLACSSTATKRGLQLLFGIQDIHLSLRFMHYCLQPTPDLVSRPSLSPIGLKHSSFPYVDAAIGT